MRDLPGESAPPEGLDPGLPKRRAAVSVLFATRDEVPAILLIRRAAHRGNHRTEWAFPGGVVEPEDATLLDTALRETHEEIGVSPSLIDSWGPLPKVITGTGLRSLAVCRAVVRQCTLNARTRRGRRLRLYPGTPTS